MRNGDHVNSCLFGEELVSYIYGELPAPERTKFELHLGDCGECVSEFALVSESRLGVYEWHRDEFVPLATPVFEIPYAKPVVVSQSTSTWLDSLRGLFSPARFATAGGLAAIALAFGIFYFSSDSETVAASDPPVSEAVSEPDISNSAPPAPPAPAHFVAQEARSDRTAGSKPTVVQVKAVTRKPSRSIEARTERAAKAPRLGNFDDVEDTSLRLSDLVADIDTDDIR